jgi:uncharacterized protein
LEFFLLSNKMMENVLITLKVIPNKKQNRILKSEGENSFKVELKARPIEGKANVELVKYLAKVLELRQNQITIARGIHSREKVLQIQGIRGQKLMEKLKAIQSP